MKIASLLLSGLVVAAMGFMTTGCNENPSDPDPQPSGGAPRNVQATSLAPNQVSLKWDAPTDSTGVTSYTVRWKMTNGADSGSVSGLTAKTHTVTTGTSNARYTFSVYAVRGTAASGAATIDWAGATRYTTDQSVTMSIRVYETQSDNGSGLTLDPPNGPMNVKVGPSNTVPRSVQLAVYTTAADPNNFEIGPAYAFTEYRNADKFDSSVYVSEMSYPAQSLNTWYSDGSIQDEIPSNGNVRAFKFSVNETGNTGQGFYVRTGQPGNYHYARVFLKKTGGKYFQGSAPNRYIEMEISYQQSANLPFAKTAGYRPTPGNIRSQVYHPLTR